MEKQDYIKLLTTKPWSKIDNFYKDKDKIPAKYIGKIKIDTDDWIQFSKDSFDFAQQKYEHEKSYIGEDENYIIRINNELGRNKSNTFELNYGINGDTNDQLIKLLGEQNIDKLGLQQEGILVRLLVNPPGHGIAWHHDAANSYFIKFPEYEGTLEGLVRLWFSVIPWENGQVFQIGSSMLYDWQAGDVWQIPWGVPHASSNFGYHLKYTVSLTGRLK